LGKGEEEMSNIIIQKTRIRKLENYLNNINDGESLIVGLHADEKQYEKLREVGFLNINSGETVLPKVIGPVSRFNANGKTLIHRDREKEIAHRVVKWTWSEFHGKERVEKTEWKDVPYERYPRSIIEPPSVEISIALDNTNVFVVSQKVEYDSRSDLILHTINLFLEIFGEAHIFSENLQPITTTELKRVNWQFLPPGEYPWEKVKEAAQSIARKLGSSKREFFSVRLELLNNYEPDFVAIGKAGFLGYIVFGFSDKNLFIFENPNYGNATYIVRENWRVLSSLTKAQLISEDLIERRIIHRKNWPEEVRKFMI
jgi:hypothetical protein